MNGIHSLIKRNHARRSSYIIALDYIYRIHTAYEQ